MQLKPIYLTRYELGSVIQLYIRIETTISNAT